MNKNQVYALYRGDTFLEIGTIEEIADFLGLTVRSVRHYRTPSYRSRVNDRKAMWLIEIEDDEYE